MSEQSREEAAAKAIDKLNPYRAGDASSWPEWEQEARAALAAADAHDAAHGIHRVSLDDATVERVARAIFPSYWDDDAAECFETPEALAECQKGCTDHARAVLAAAVEAGQ